MTNELLEVCEICGKKDICLNMVFVIEGLGIKEVRFCSYECIRGHILFLKNKYGLEELDGR